MTTFQQLIDECRDQYLMTGSPDKVNVLHTSILAGDDTLVLRYASQGVAAGTRLAIGLEEFHVIETSGTTAEATITVIPAFNSSTAAAHNAGDLVRITPQFSDFRIARAINRCIESLPGDGLFQIKSVDFDYIPATAGYNLNTPDMLSVWRVRYKIPGPSKSWPVMEARDYYLDNAADTTDFVGGRQLLLRMPGFPGNKIRVSYHATLPPLTVPADDVQAVTGLLPSAHEIPAMGAAFRLLVGRDIKRSFLNAQPEPRRADEVPPGAATNAMLPLAESYYRAIEREIELLNRLYPQQL